jgi:hypothetical protein
MMTTNTRRIWILMFCLTLAVVAGMSQLALPAAGAEEQAGQMTVTGTVKVDGKPVATGDILPSGSEIQTAKGSSAVVSLGSLGRVEVLPSTTVKLRYDGVSTTHNPASVAILLGDGSVKVSTGDGIRFNIESGMTATRPVSRTEQNVFTVDSTCGNTLVSVAQGKVELLDANKVKQIVAGGQDRGGQAKRGCTPSRTL